MTNSTDILLTPQMKKAIKLLNTEFEWRERNELYDYRVLNDDAEYYEYDRSYRVCDQTVPDFLKSVGASLQKGCNLTALVFPTAIIKWETHPSQSFHDWSATKHNVALYRKVKSSRSVLTKHISVTDAIGDFTVQERCIPAVDVFYKFRAEKKYDALCRVIDVAISLSLSDLHDENWGYRLSDSTFTTPVVFDFSSRTDKYNDWTNTVRDIWEESIGWPQSGSKALMNRIEKYLAKKYHYAPRNDNA